MLFMMAPYMNPHMNSPPSELPDPGYQERLLRQMNHRFQNNVQWLALLLEFQPANAPPEATRLLNGVAARLRSLSGVYGLRAESAGGIVDAATLITAIIRNAEKAHRLRIDYEPDSPGGRQARQWQVTDGMTVAVAVLLGEIVDNAIKHRSGTTPPRVGIVESGGGLTISVANTGQLPPDRKTAWRTDSGIGLELADTLSQMRSGISLDFKCTDGWIITGVGLRAPAIEPCEADNGRT